MTDYSAWLVEIMWGNDPVYFQLAHDDDWTKDHDKALHFCRKIDAENCIEHYGWTMAKPVEHMWAAASTEHASVLPADLKAMSGSTESDRVIQLHFNRTVMDQDRKWLLDAINAWWPATSPLSAAPSEGKCQKCGAATCGEEAWVNGQIWCHPCADDTSTVSRHCHDNAVRAASPLSAAVREGK